MRKQQKFKKRKEFTFEFKELNNVYLDLPAELTINQQKIKKFGNAEDIIQNHMDIFSNIIDNLKGSIKAGGTTRKNKKKTTLGINADSINSAIRNKLKNISDINLETSVEYGSFIPQSKKSDFDFSIYDKRYNLFNIWNYCYGIEARYNGDEIYKNLIQQNDTLSKDWEKYMICHNKSKYTKDLSVPSDAFNIVGEIQFGNWAMVYKDMFRLVTAINKNARINLYVYICAEENLSKYISDGTVCFEKACDEFEKNVNNHSINCPVVIIPLNIRLKFDDNKDDKDYIENYKKLQENLNNYKSLYKEISKDVKNYNNDIKKYTKDVENYNTKPTDSLKEKISRKRKSLSSKRATLNNKVSNLATLYKEIMEIGIITETVGD